MHFIRIIILPTLVALLLPAPPARAAMLKFGDPAPLFSLPDQSGRKVALQDFVGPRQGEHGAGAILVFFTTWCPVCKKELPRIAALNEEFRKRGITIILIGFQEEREKTAAYAKTLADPLLIVLSDASGAAGASYHVRFLPTIYAVTAEGKIKDLLFGASRDIQYELRKIADKLEIEKGN